MIHRPQLNYDWSLMIAQCLQANAVTRVICCPGSRNVPLLVACQQLFGEGCESVLDERAAAFYACGLAQRLGEPVALCVTSGSAVANVLPALTEAYESRVPLIILSADRPRILQNSGAPQTVNQEPMLAGSCQSMLALTEPAEEIFEQTAERIQETLYAGIVLTRGPVHINIPFEEPLIDEAVQTVPQICVRENLYQRQRVQQSCSIPSFPACGQRGCIIVGARNPLSWEQVDYLARTTGFPVIVDVPANLRQPAVYNAIAYADLLLKESWKDQQADVLIRIGSAPVARSVYEWCAGHICPIIRIDDYLVEKDFLHESFFMMVQPTDSDLQQLAVQFQTVEREWTQRWTKTNTELLQHYTAPEWNEIQVMVDIVTMLEQLQVPHVHVANSMAIRYLNMLLPCKNREMRITANRGVNGVDGTLATFAGQCEPGSVLICGDLSFLYDATSLVLLSTQQCRIIILNNHGGRIFNMLPTGQVSGIQHLVQTPHQQSCAAIAQAYGCDAHVCEDREQLQQSLHMITERTDCLEVLLPSDEMKNGLHHLQESVKKYLA